MAVFIADKYESTLIEVTGKRLADVKVGTFGSNSVPIYHFDSYNLLNQFIGYVKYQNRKCGNVYLRGQSDLYGAQKMIPSALRGIDDEANRLKKSRSLIRKSAKQAPNLCEMPENVLYPLLQHYGIKTEWLDLVDNTWVSIWFALHKSSSTIIGPHQHVDFFDTPDDRFGYIFLMLVDAQKEGLSGTYKGGNTLLTDLRKAAPSIFLRPHAQHGLMVRKAKGPFMDYSDLVVGVAQIDVKQGFERIGRKGMLSTHSLFPPATYDHGFRLLLEQYDTTGKDAQFIDSYGSIQIVT